MSDIDIEKALYRIIQGRLRYKVRDGLVLYIHAPTPDIIYESHDVYDEAYEDAYWKGIYVKQEIIPILLENNYWSPLDDREAERLQKEIEDQKIEAFKSFMNKKKLSHLKRHIFSLEKQWKLAFVKKTSLDHITCEGVAALAKTHWIVSKTARFSDGRLYDWKEASIPVVTNYLAVNAIDPEMYRSIARSEGWRGIWGAGKGTDIFGVPYSQITQEQARLCSYSRMYDNVAEHHESPSQEIVEDDICLDGWFISQDRKMKAEKKKNQADGMISNDKIRNSGEVFVMAQDKENAEEIYDMNNPLARGTLRQREAQIEGAENMNFKDLHDVKQDIQVQRQQMISDRFKKGK